ncbi:hypothetical protein UlMin_042391 [Ulmus minor]
MRRGPRLPHLAELQARPSCPSWQHAQALVHLLRTQGRPAAQGTRASRPLPHGPSSFCPHLDVLLQYPLNGIYPGVESIVPSRSIPPIINTGTTWPLYSSALPVVSGFGGASQTEDLVLIVLCPFEKIGYVIGKCGNTIKGIRQASGARIEVADTRGDRDECIITITATESIDDLKSMAVEAVLSLQGKINGEDEDMFTIRLLIPSKGIECIIEKSGSIISDIRKRTRADVHISKGEKPKFALIVILREADNVKDALVQIVLRLRDDVLKERDGAPNPFVGTESLYSDGSGLSISSVLPSVPPVALLGYAQRANSGSGLGMISSSSLYGYGSLPVCSYMDILPIPSTLDMMIPANAVGKVLGKEIAGAMVEISESKSSWGDCIAHIS